MAKEEPLELEGVIDEILPGGQFRVKLDSEHMVLVYTAGKMRKHRIRSMVGDRVTVEMTPYDLTRGRLIFRHRDASATTTGAPGRRAPYRPRR
jgi:translation initiation factor IF-1